MSTSDAILFTRLHHSWPGHADTRGEKRIVAPRDEVNRLAHERRLDDRAPLERPREIVAAELVETGPEPDIPIGRVLVLDPADPLERPRESAAWNARAEAAALAALDSILGA